ncbi:MAG: hypothetical protein P1P87_00670 [Trueperaceae bacterium]|nr:hypothetical protein [Trueperaceae bacterium]
MVDPHVCLTCGAHLPGDTPPPALCPICDEPRQYVEETGQAWGRHDALLAGHGPRIEEEAFGLVGVGLEPPLAIGQRALLVRTPEGNVLWDCVPLLHDATVARLRELGGVRAIAVSHPHFTTGVARFAAAFDADVVLHAADRAFVTHPHPRLRFWDGERQPLFGGVELVRAGGHFPGGTVLHWPAGANGRGVLLTGDIVMVVPDRRYVAFMYSYPNLIPLPVREVERIGAALEPLAVEAIVGGWWGRVVAADGKDVVRRSVERYRQAVAGRLDGASVPWPDAPG